MAAFTVTRMDMASNLAWKNIRLQECGQKHITGFQLHFASLRSKRLQVVNSQYKGDAKRFDYFIRLWVIFPSTLPPSISWWEKLTQVSIQFTFIGHTFLVLSILSAGSLSSGFLPSSWYYLMGLGHILLIASWEKKSINVKCQPVIWFLIHLRMCFSPQDFSWCCSLQDSGLHPICSTLHCVVFHLTFFWIYSKSPCIYFNGHMHFYCNGYMGLQRLVHYTL